MFNWMNNFRILGLVVALAIRLPAADPGKSVAKAMAGAMSRQRQSVASMSASLAAQRRSLASQIARMPARPWPTLSVIAPPVLDPIPACPPLPPTELDSLVDDVAQREELEPNLIRSVIRQESAARPCAVSSKGAMGLMQLMPATVLQFGVSDAFDPRENVNAGARLLKQLLTMYGGDMSLALGAFNAGPGKVNEVGGVPNYPETRDYVQKVLSLLAEHEE